MDFAEKMASLGKRVTSISETLKNEEMTKNALVMPFISALGYDVFNPAEVVPEYSASIGEYKDARVDYAILDEEGKPIVIIECKAYGIELDRKHCNQLQLYFHGTEAPIALLTNGNRYMFYTDLEKPNVMDQKPYMDFCLTEMTDQIIPELYKLSKGNFEKVTALAAANEMKYSREFLRLISEQMENPDDEFSKFFISKVHEGQLRQSVVEKFKPILMKAFKQYIANALASKIKDAFDVKMPSTPTKEQDDNQQNQSKNSVQLPSPQEGRVDPDNPNIITTPIEFEAYYLVKALLIGVVPSERVTLRDAVNFCNILLDNNQQKPIFRLYFNNQEKLKVGCFDKEKKEEKIDIECLDDILKLADKIRGRALAYDEEVANKIREKVASYGKDTHNE